MLDAATPTTYPRYWLKLRIKQIELTALVDPGAARTILGAKGCEIAQEIGAKIQPSVTKHAIVANGVEVPVQGELSAPLEIAGVRKPVRILVIPDVHTDCTLGLDLIRTFGMIIDANRDSFTLADLKDRKEIAFDLWAIGTDGNKVDIASCGLNKISCNQQETIDNLIDELLPKTTPTCKILPTTDLIEHEIKVINNAKPVKQRYYPVSEKLEKVMHDELEKLREAGIVEKSRSPWNSPVVMIKKPNNSYRMCIDLKAVNAISEKDAYPTPYMDVILNKLKRAKFITTIDLKSAYHQISLKLESRPITAFTIPGKGHWQFTRLPMGLSGAGASFQRLLEEIIGDLEPYAYNYLDDIVLATETFEEHIQMLRKLILKIKDSGLTINREKSKFCCNEVKFLGFIVNEHGLMIDPDKTAAITNYPKPRT